MIDKKINQSENFKIIDGISYFTCGKTTIKITEHFSENKSVLDLVENAIKHDYKINK